MDTIQPVFPDSRTFARYLSFLCRSLPKPDSSFLYFAHKQSAQFFYCFLSYSPVHKHLFTFCVYPLVNLSTFQKQRFLLKIELFTELSTLSTKKLCTPSRGYFMSITNVRFVHIHEIDFSAKKYCYSIDKSPVRKTT